MEKRYVLAAALVAALLVFASAFLSVSRECAVTGISERYYNLIDDDCDLLVDEDYVRTFCGNGLLEAGEFCDDGNRENLDGCSMDCKAESNSSIYVVPYVGNIDGDFDEEWYYVYDMITDFHERNSINAGFSIYPVSIKTGEFGRIFAKMYNSPYIEFIQKGYRGGGNKREETIDTLSFEEQKEIIEAGQERFRKMGAKVLGTDEDDIDVPLSYNQPQGRVTEGMRDALKEAGFKIFFDLYMNEDIGPVKSTPDFDVVQYGVSITTTGEAGRHTVFMRPDDVINEVKTFEREDLYVLNVSGRKVVPVWFHHYDLEDKERDDMIDWGKWKIYTDIMLKLKQDQDMIIVRPSDIYDMRHSG